MASACKHFQPSIREPGDCLVCERAKSPSTGPLVSFAGVGRENWRTGQTNGEFMREFREDIKHLPKDRQPEYVGPRRRKSK